MFNNSHTYQYVLVTAVVLVVVVILTVFQLRFWFQGPQLDISETHYETQTGKVDLVFMVSNTERVFLNGVEVVPRFDGLVQESVYVGPGNSVLSIDLHDKYGTHKRNYLYIVYPHK